MARKDNDPEKKPFVRRVYILLAILLGLLLPFVLVIPSMIEEHACRNQLMKNVPNEVLIHGLSKSLFGGSSWEKNDLDRIVGVKLREDETTMCGFACMKYWNNRNVSTQFDDLRFYVFENKRSAKAALSQIKENLGEITDEGDNYVRGWERDLSNYRMYIRLIREIEKYGMLIGGIRAQTVIWSLLRIMSRSGFSCMTESRMNQKATLM